MIRNLGAALTVLLRQEASEHFMHADVSAFGAPSECHSLVSRGEALRARRARKMAESIAQRPMRVIAKEAAQRGLPIGSPKWQLALSRYYAKTYPF